MDDLPVRSLSPAGLIVQEPPESPVLRKHGGGGEEDADYEINSCPQD